MQTMQNVFNDSSGLLPQGNAQAMIDPAKLLEASHRIQRLIEQENKNRDARLHQLAESRAKLTQAIHDMEERQQMIGIERVRRITGIVTTIESGVQGVVQAPQNRAFSQKALWHRFLAYSGCSFAAKPH